MRARNVLLTRIPIALVSASPLAAQGTVADYEQAMTLRGPTSRLQGRVLLVVAEMDKNVDPSSTMQVVNQLIKHNKDFELLVIPGMGHGSGGAYGEHKRYDFFTRHRLGVTPPDWATLDEALKKKVGSRPRQTADSKVPS